ncbi:acyl-CoA thioesterase [Silvimonas sp. JCM 19000]
MPTEPSASDPRWRAQIELTIPFHDLDPLDIVWHGNYVRYFEHARTALFQQLDYDVPAMRASGYVWPVIELNIRYARPLRYMQRIVVSAHIVEWENRLKVRYEIHDHASGARLTRGHTVQVAVVRESGEMCYVCPPVLLQKLGVTV